MLQEYVHEWKRVMICATTNTCFDNDRLLFRNGMIHLSPRWGLVVLGYLMLYTFRTAGAEEIEFRRSLQQCERRHAERAYFYECKRRMSCANVSEFFLLDLGFQTFLGA